MVEPHNSNFRVITTNVLGVRIFRKFTVLNSHKVTFTLGTKLKCLSLVDNDFSKAYMGPIKRTCVFEYSVMTNFNCACPAIQMGQGSGFLSEGSS